MVNNKRQFTEQEQQWLAQGHAKTDQEQVIAADRTAVFAYLREQYQAFEAGVISLEQGQALCRGRVLQAIRDTMDRKTRIFFPNYSYGINCWFCGVSTTYAHHIFTRSRCEHCGAPRKQPK